jgi:hypothetical protein
MMPRAVKGILLPALMSTALASLAEAKTLQLPRVPPPPAGTAQWVAERMRLNGLPMTLQSFDTRMEVDALLHHYEQWARGAIGAETFRTRSGDWQVLSLRSDAHLITIQARANGGGSHGTIAVSPRLEKRAVALVSLFPLPRSLRIVTLQQYDDAGMQAEHIGVLSERAPHIEARALATALTAAGWQVTRERPAQRTPRGYVLEAQKGAQHASIVVLPDRANATRTAAIIVWRKA